MKVYTIAFTYFCSHEWDFVDTEIKAISMIQLIRTFIDQTRSARQGDTTRSVWDGYKNNIREEELTFPIISSNSLNY